MIINFQKRYFSERKMIIERSMRLMGQHAIEIIFLAINASFVSIPNEF